MAIRYWIERIEADGENERLQHTYFDSHGKAQGVATMLAEETGDEYAVWPDPPEDRSQDQNQPRQRSSRFRL